MIFFTFRQDPGQLPQCRGPFDAFSEAAEKVDGAVTPLIVQFSLVYGWLSIWELRGQRWELLRESADGLVLRERQS